ncbi:hypothetical protein JB92DRAFT_3130894 [Gautieria morchelliformis]|nr:hypothetical protein JB92DRAFT_3130894 [Gautieria morchelliformis]
MPPIPRRLLFKPSQLVWLTSQRESWYDTHPNEPPQPQYIHHLTRMYMLFFNMERLSRTQQYPLESMIDLWWHFSPPGQPPCPLFAIDELELIDLTQDLPEGRDLNERMVIDLTMESHHEDSA